MQQELTQLRNLEEIDPETARRLQQCLGFQFVSCPIRYFRARKAIFIAAASKPLSIRISGFGELFQGERLTCCNIDNPEDLEISIDSCDLLIQSARDPDILYVKDSMASISGKKSSNLAKGLDNPAKVLQSLPKRDPDLVQIDERIFRQTGTVYIQSPFYFVILERQGNE